MKTLKESNGDLVMPLRFIEGSEFNKQTIDNALSTWRGSWYKDLSKGIDYQGMLDQQYSKGEIIEDMRAEVINTGVAESVPYLDLGSDGRNLSINWIAKESDDNGSN